MKFIFLIYRKLIGLIETNIYRERYKTKKPLEASDVVCFSVSAATRNETSFDTADMDWRTANVAFVKVWLEANSSTNPTRTFWLRRRGRHVETAMCKAGTHNRLKIVIADQQPPFWPSCRIHSTSKRLVGNKEHSSLGIWHKC